MKVRTTILLGTGIAYGLQACNDYDIGSYQPLPKVELQTPFKYRCIPENYTQLNHDSLGKVAIINFHKEDVTQLDYIDYDEESCTFSFHKGKTAKYRISWNYESKKNALNFLYGQNNMWYEMTNNKNSYILEANDGMSIRVVVYRTYNDSLNFTINHFSIEAYEDSIPSTLQQHTSF